LRTERRSVVWCLGRHPAFDRPNPPGSMAPFGVCFLRTGRLQTIYHPGIQRYEARSVAADGTLRDVIFHKATYTDECGSISGLVGVILDIRSYQRAGTHHRRQAHTIKGAAANIGAPALRAAAYEIEELGKKNDLGPAAKGLLRLEAEFERLKKILKPNLPQLPHDRLDFRPMLGWDHQHLQRPVGDQAVPGAGQRPSNAGLALSLISQQVQ
jgi:Hpt domain